MLSSSITTSSVLSLDSKLRLAVDDGSHFANFFVVPPKTDARDEVPTETVPVSPDFVKVAVASEVRDARLVFVEAAFVMCECIFSEQGSSVLDTSASSDGLYVQVVPSKSMELLDAV